MNDPNNKKLPEAGIGILGSMRELNALDSFPEAGIGFFSDYKKIDGESLPEAGLGLFSHWTEDE